MKLFQQSHIFRIFSLSFFLLFSANSLCRAQDRKGLLISPLNHTTRGRSGTKDVAEFRISNGLNTRVNIDVKLLDLTQTTSGSPVLSEPGTTPHSAAKWISLKEGLISLGPGEEQVVQARITIPAGATGSYHAAVTLKLFAAGKAASDSSSAAIVNQTILPLHVFVNGTLKPKVELEGAELKPALGNIMVMDENSVRGQWVMFPHVHNTGNSMVRLKGDVIVTSGRGELVGRYQVGGGDPEGQAVLPDSTIAFPIIIHNPLPDEQYQARISLRYQGVKRIEGYSAPMTLKPHAPGKTPDAPPGQVELGAVERTGLQALVEPRVVIGNVQPNSVRTQRITITNLEDFPVSVAATASGLAIDVDGEPIALPDAATAAWMAIAPANFRLGPLQNRVISVRMNAPADQGDRWGMLQFSIASANPAVSTLTTTARTMVLLRNAANTTASEAKAEKVAITRSGAGPTVSITFANTQDRPLAFTSSSLQLLPVVDNPPVGTTAPDPINISGESDIVLLPNTSRRLDFVLPEGIAPTQYSGVMKLSGLAASNGAQAINDFGVKFNLNLTDPRSTNKQEAPAPKPKHPTPTKPLPKKPVPAKPKAGTSKPKIGTPQPKSPAAKPKAKG